MIKPEKIFKKSFQLSDWTEEDYSDRLADKIVEYFEGAQSGGGLEEVISSDDYSDWSISY